MQSLKTLRIPAFLLLAAASAVIVIAAAAALDPPQPDFFWPYGTVQADGANIVPAEQPVVAMINGAACGESTTKIALAGPGTPPGDAGKTVYVLNVLADGPGAGQRVGCGHIGDPVTLYFPALGRIGGFHPTFQVGGLRVDLDLTQTLGERQTLGLLAADGAP